MKGSYFVTAAILRAILCFIDAQNTPKIAYDNDAYTNALIKAVTDAVGQKDGSQSCIITFDETEDELCRQFVGVCGNISKLFSRIN